MKLSELLDEQQRADLAETMLTLRANFNRAVVIIEQAAAGKEVEAPVLERLALMRQMAAALDVQILLPTPGKGERAAELARQTVELVFNGPAPQGFASPPGERPEEGPGEWSETIE